MRYRDVARGRAAVLCAAGRLPEYGAMIEERLRPLFDVFGARPMEPHVYASDGDVHSPITVRA